MGIRLNIQGHGVDSKAGASGHQVVNGKFQPICGSKECAEVELVQFLNAWRFQALFSSSQTRPQRMDLQPFDSLSSFVLSSDTTLRGQHHTSVAVLARRRFVSFRSLQPLTKPALFSPHVDLSCHRSQDITPQMFQQAPIFLPQLRRDHREPKPHRCNKSCSSFPFPFHFVSIPPASYQASTSSPQLELCCHSSLEMTPQMPQRALIFSPSTQTRPQGAKTTKMWQLL